MYDPGINRFVGADHYVGAAANLALQADPLTGNAYLYAGANPVNLIDDGHHPCGRRGWHYRPCWGKKAKGTSKPGRKGSGSGGGSPSPGSGSEAPANPVLAAMMGPMPDPGVDCDALWRDVVDARNSVSGKADKLADGWKGRGRLETEFVEAQGTLRARYANYAGSRCTGHTLPADIGGLMGMTAPTPGGDPLAALLGFVGGAGGKLFSFGVSGYKECVAAGTAGAGYGAQAGWQGSLLGGAIGCLHAYGWRLFFSRASE